LTFTTKFCAGYLNDISSVAFSQTCCRCPNRGSRGCQPTEVREARLERSRKLSVSRNERGYGRIASDSKGGDSGEPGQGLASFSNRSFCSACCT
jgi:hypothetical protein